MSVDSSVEVESNPNKGRHWFRKPGVAILWIQYHFPSQGRVLVSARQYQNPVVELIYSIIFWGFLAVWGISLVVGAVAGLIKML